MGVIQSAYRRKRRNAEDRKRRPIVFLIAEGKNKTETLYFKAFGHDMNRNVRFAPGDYTDPVNMVSTLKNFMADNDFSPELGDKACSFEAELRLTVPFSDSSHFVNLSDLFYLFSSISAI